MLEANILSRRTWTGAETGTGCRIPHGAGLLSSPAIGVGFAPFDVAPPSCWMPLFRHGAAIRGVATRPRGGVLVPYRLRLAWHYSVHDASQPIFFLHPR